MTRHRRRATLDSPDRWPSGRATFEPGPPPAVPVPPETADDQGVIGVGVRGIDQQTEKLVVTGRGQVKAMADGDLLATGFGPPHPLEIDDGAITLRQAH